LNINDKLTFKTQDNPPQIGQYDYLYDELEELKEQATASGNQILHIPSRINANATQRLC